MYGMQHLRIEGVDKILDAYVSEKRQDFSDPVQPHSRLFIENIRIL